MTRRAPPYLRLVNPVAFPIITIRTASTADAARHLLDGAMNGLMNVALDHGFTGAFGTGTRSAIAEVIERDLGAWVARHETVVLARRSRDGDE